MKENDNTNLWHKIKAELSQVQSNKPLHKNPERSYINNDDTLEMFRKAIRNDIHRVYRKKKSTSGWIQWNRKNNINKKQWRVGSLKKKQQDWQSVAKLTKWKGEKKMNKIKIKRETFIFVWINAPHHS